MSSKPGQADVRTETLSATASPVQTVSEIYPDDSASHRPANHEIQEEDDAQDGQSIVSLHTSDAESLQYTIIGGRTFTSQSEIYVLPADEEEHRRLNLQHMVLRICLNGLFPFQELVGPLLREGQPEPPNVLDVGTGSGQWALDMATTYPWANVVGSDLVPPALIAKDKVPSNCRFEIDDANLPLEHYSQTFNLVHARAISRGLNDAHSFFYQVARTLKPGGVFLMVHGDLQMRDENLVPLPFVEPGEPRFTWLQYICGQVQNAWRNRGGFTHHLRWKEWLESNPNYSEVRQRDLDIPVGAWKEGISDQESVAANLMKENISNVLESWRRLIVGDGHHAEDVNRWIQECKLELKNLRVHSHMRGDWTAPDETTREILKEA